MGWMPAHYPPSDAYVGPNNARTNHNLNIFFQSINIMCDTFLFVIPRTKTVATQNKYHKKYNIYAHLMHPYMSPKNKEVQ